jgi:hypothetical protein
MNLMNGSMKERGNIKEYGSMVVWQYGRKKGKF